MENGEGIIHLLQHAMSDIIVNVDDDSVGICVVRTLQKLATTMAVDRFFESYIGSLRGEVLLWLPQTLHPTAQQISYGDGVGLSMTDTFQEDE